MMQFVEAVPNLSEGKNSRFLSHLTEELSRIENLWILGLESNEDAHRSVLTLVGEISAMKRALLLMFELASKEIDMRTHKGVHLRVGAVDVCPIIPLGSTTLDQAHRLAREIGEEVWQGLGIPISFYQYSASSPERYHLVDHRKGQYEGLQERLTRGDYHADLGGDRFNPKSGLSILGARNFLIAYNVNLEDASLAQAKRVAESLRSNRDDPRKEHLKGVHIMGWYLAEQRLAQISCNLTDFRQSGLFDVFFEVKKAALLEDIRVTGSELIGLAPLEAFVARPSKDPEALEGQLQQVIQSLGLGDLTPFDPKQKVLELRLKELGGPDEI